MIFAFNKPNYLIVLNQQMYKVVYALVILYNLFKLFNFELLFILDNI